MLPFKRSSGFTLIELMIVVAIVGILSAIAVPQYQEHVLKSKLTEPRSILSQQRVKMEQYFQDQRSYVGACAPGTIAPIPPNSTDFTYGCVIAAPPAAPSYTITATGRAGTNMAGFTFSINEQNIRATVAVPPGWNLPPPPPAVQCWVINRGGQC